MSGGPLGLLGVVATVATGWLLFRDNTEQAKIALDDIGKSAEEVTEKLNKMTRAQVDAYGQQMEEALNKLKADREKLINEMEDKSPTKKYIEEADFSYTIDNKEVIAAFDEMKVAFNK